MVVAREVDTRTARIHSVHETAITHYMTPFQAHAEISRIVNDYSSKVAAMRRTVVKLRQSAENALDLCENEVGCRRVALRGA